MKKFTMLLAMLAFLVAPILGGQSLPRFERWLGADTAGLAIAAISTDVAMVVTYSGPGDATIAVAAGGIVTFQVDSAAYTGFECPESGVFGGIMDPSDAECDYFGEFQDVVNADTNGYFKAVLVGALRTDSTDNTLITLVTADVGAGKGLLFDGTVTDEVNIVLSTKQSATDYITGGLIQQDPYDGKRVILQTMVMKITNAGTNTEATLACLERSYDGVAVNETVTNLTTLIGTTTGAWATFDDADFGSFGFIGCKHGAMHVRIVDDGAGNITAAVVYAHALEMEVQ